MKKQDFLFIFVLVIIFLPFFVSEPVYDWYKSFNAAHGMVMSFIKFGILATLGEMLGLRISALCFRQEKRPFRQTGMVNLIATGHFYQSILCYTLMHQR